MFIKKLIKGYKIANHEELLEKLDKQAIKLNEMADKADELRAELVTLEIECKATKEIVDEYSNKMKVFTGKDIESVKEKLKIETMYETFSVKLEDYIKQIEAIKASISSYEDNYKKQYKKYMKYKRALGMESDEVEPNPEDYLNEFNGLEKLEVAQENFLHLMTEILNDTERGIGNKITALYKKDSIFEGRFIIDNLTFIVSVDTENNWIKVAKSKGVAPETIGQGHDFKKIEWINDSYDIYLVLAYQQLLALEDSLKQKMEFEDDTKLKFTYLASSLTFAN